MADETTTTVKELYLGFTGSDGKTKRLVIAHPEDNLDANDYSCRHEKNCGMPTCSKKQGIQLYTNGESASYMTRIKK